MYEEIYSWDECSHWGDKQQQDAGELLAFLIGRLRKENEEAGRLFEGDQRSLKTCTKCLETTPNDEETTIISLDTDTEAKKKKLVNEDCKNLEQLDTTIEDLLAKCGEHEVRKKRSMVRNM